jgi:chromosome segregation ATPase
MAIENMMYFALGVLVAGLVALLIMPAVWRRAVRLTKKRIEAATPMTMAEFRADKDQLRAEFALSTRRLEMNVEALRRRLAEQLSDMNRKKTEVGAIIGERDNRMAILRELETREAEARNRILALEKESADLAQKLRMRDREFADKASQLEEARAALKERTGRGTGDVRIEGQALSGEYDKDVRELAGLVDAERKRAGFLEAQNRALIAQLESADRRSGEAVEAAAELRATLSRRADEADEAKDALVAAEAHMAEAESRVSALLEQTGVALSASEAAQSRLLAEKLSLEDELEKLKAKVLNVESSLMADWDSERIEQSHLRERLNDIAADVARLVYAIDEGGTLTPDESETLLARVQKFADDGSAARTLTLRGALETKQAQRGGAVSDRMAALREIQERG